MFILDNETAYLRLLEGASDYIFKVGKHLKIKD